MSTVVKPVFVTSNQSAAYVLPLPEGCTSEMMTLGEPAAETRTDGDPMTTISTIALPKAKYLALRSRFSVVVMDSSFCHAARKQGKTHAIGFDRHRSELTLLLLVRDAD
jgi:hypothetical protein